MMNNKYSNVPNPAAFGGGVGSRSPGLLGAKKGNSKKGAPQHATRQRRKTESDSSSSPSPSFKQQNQQQQINYTNYMRGGSPTGSYNYAGAKFSEPPSPAQLPIPPTHWMSADKSSDCHHMCKEDKYTEITNQLKLMLNIRA